MRITTLALAAATSLGLSAVSTSAATFTLDDFTTTQAVQADPASDSTVSGGAGTGIAAGERTLFVDNTVGAPTGDGNATNLTSNNGFLTFSNEAGARGIGTVTYSDVNLMNDVDTGFFFFDVLVGDGQFDGDAVFSLFAEDDGGETVSYTENLLSGFSPILRFKDLDNSDDDFDFFNVATLSFTIDTTKTAGSIDGTLASIDVSAVPLPASSLLLLGGLGGLVAMRRRKKAA